MFILFLDHDRIGQVNQINGHLALPLVQIFGEKMSHQGCASDRFIEHLFELMQVAELSGEFTQDWSRGSAPKILTGLEAVLKIYVPIKTMT
ncbi:hypothetical protein C2W62_39440 [Candidatus Entotheonella serta]|nr:hypothetical protein C2W62_39440 [Candidatus Entotheonella serta]